MANFAFMSGTGNDFLVGAYEGPVSEIQIIALVSDAEYEVDGVIFVEPINEEIVKSSNVRIIKWSINFI